MLLPDGAVAPPVRDMCMRPGDADGQKPYRAGRRRRARAEEPADRHCRIARCVHMLPWAAGEQQLFAFVCCRRIARVLSTDDRVPALHEDIRRSFRETHDIGSVPFDSMGDLGATSAPRRRPFDVPQNERE